MLFRFDIVDSDRKEAEAVLSTIDPLHDICTDQDMTASPQNMVCFMYSMRLWQWRERRA